MHLFCKFGGVGGCWLSGKWLEPQNNREIRGFCPLGPPTERRINLLIIIAKIRSSKIFFMQKVCFQRVWFSLWGLLNGRN